MKLDCEQLTDLLRGRSPIVDGVEVSLTVEAECEVYNIVEDMKHDDRIEKGSLKYDDDPGGLLEDEPEIMLD